MTIERLMEELKKYDKDLIVVLETDQFWDNIGQVVKKVNEYLANNGG